MDNLTGSISDVTNNVVSNGLAKVAGSSTVTTGSDTLNVLANTPALVAGWVAALLRTVGL